MSSATAGVESKFGKGPFVVPPFATEVEELYCWGKDRWGEIGDWEVVKDWLCLGVWRGRMADFGSGGGVELRRRQDVDRSRERSFGGVDR